MTKDQLSTILFIDIETAPMAPRFDLLPENFQRLWEHKSKWYRNRDPENADPAKVFEDKAGIFSEFSKVVCISFGSLVVAENAWTFRLKSLTDEDEKTLLNNFSSLCTRFRERQQKLVFCGHNIKEFDLPFLCRRMIINGIPLPQPLQLQHCKPWDHPHIDTLELWRFGDLKNFTSLALLAEVLGIPSPKSDLDGSMVAKVYWEDKDLKRIADYCMQDVITAARVYLQLTGNSDCNFSTVFA
jgi:predicted PolB exonuclease-like 3'-5' exonuclease